MTPKEKAKELVLKMWDDTPNRNFDKTKELTEENYLGIDDAITCALIAVEEILRIAEESQDVDHIAWWQEVKQHLQSPQP